MAKHGQDTAADLAAMVSAALARPVRRLTKLDRRIVVSDDVDTLHDLRVATRRVQSQLRTFRPVLDRDITSALREELTWSSQPLGAVRDLDVQIDLLDGKLRELGKHHHGLELMSRLLDERVRARRALLGRVESERAMRLRERLVETVDAPPIRHQHRHDDPVDTIRKLGRRPWRDLVHAVDALDDQPADHELHHVRLLAKRARYAAEAVARLTPLHARPLVERLAALQQVLGDHQDATVARAWLGDAARTVADREEAFVLGEIAGMLRSEQAKLRAEWPAAWDAANDPPLRAWMKR